MTQIQKTTQVRGLLTNPKFRDQIAQVLPAHLTADRMSRLAIAALTRTPKLENCTQESIFRAMMDASMLGLEPDGRHAHLIPYGTECQLIPDFKGFAALLMETGQVKRIYADVVCENDTYRENVGDVIEHVPDRKNDRGEPYAAYCIIENVQGGRVCQIMSRDEILKVRNAAPGAAKKDSPWQTWPHEMWKKTVFKRACKWMSIRSTNRLQDAISLDDGVSMSDAYVMPHEPENRLNAAIEAGEK